MSGFYTPLLFWGMFFLFLKLTEQNPRHKRNISPELPRIMTQDGHLVFKSGINHNITFQAVSGGFINVGSEDLSVIVQTVKDNKQTIEQLKTVTTTQAPSNLASRLAEVEQRLNNLQPTGQVLSQLTDLTNRISSIENVQHALNNRLNQVEQSLGSTGRLQTNVARLTTTVSNLNRRVDSLESQDFDSEIENVRRLQRQVNQLRQLLTVNECTSNPCRNGGTCVDTYNGFICRCPSTWQGVTCEQDVNECGIYAGTDLGCQNGATCVNTQGGFTCHCRANWHGVRCTERHDDCTGASNQEMCGHGTCVNAQRVQPNMPKYTCICDTGWAKSRSDPACTVDVDECTERPNACSADPPVQCINLPGTFQCGQCPSGFVGNGFSCADINECAENNGGCSLAPRVDCVNTRGSRSCGPCPAGYQGNGISCYWIGFCGNNNGGCHPQATCSENQGFGGRICTCPPGYVGNGVGNSGCAQQGTSTGACTSNPCRNGALCQNSGSSFRCVCNPGFAGTTCQTNVNECSSNPCQNGGTCTDGINGYRCQCASSYSGTNCEEQQQSCGGVLTGETGTLTFPTTQGVTYPHGVDCAWEIRGTSGKIIILTFTQFSVEQHQQCHFDYLQIHDGPSASHHRIGKYCGTTLPNGGTVNSTTHKMYLWFHSDDSIAHDGFSLTWRSALPVCGGVISGSNHGIINSPGYPGNYPNNRDCVWRISVNPGNNIVLAFAALDLERHANCSHDYLKIRDGSSDTSRLLGTYCNGSTLPASLMTTSPHGYILFHSDHSITRRGFQLTYAGVSAGPQCGGTLTNSSNTVMSPNYPSPYRHDASCVWVITVHQGDTITLTFVAMDIEHHSNCQYDYVLVRDGPDENHDLLGRWCGNDIPATLTSTTNNLYIEFRSDADTAGTGFKATYTTGCGGTFTTEEGAIHSPYYPDPYPGNKQCIYIINLPVGSTVTLTFNTFDLESSSGSCSYDYLEIRDGPSADSTLINQLCGSEVPQPVSTTQNQMWIKFVSDGSVHNRGFQASYAASSATCGGLLTEDTGSFNSPGHPNVYPHGVNCTWQIRVSPGLVIRLTFNTFSLEQNPNCQYDYVQVFDNSTAFPGSGLGKKCGSTAPPVVTSTDNVMTVQFVSDESIAHEGFSSSYVALNASTLCGNALTDQTGLITSPNYPNDYPHNRECVWTITANNGNQILLNITDFRLETHANCAFDFLEIRNGGYPSSPLLGPFCGTTIDPIIRSHSNRLYIKFKSDNSMSAKGFQIYYDSTASGCGADLITPTGSFVSPNYPSPYSHNAECFWTIIVSKGSTIQLVFVDFDLENHHRCGYDYVEVREGGPHGQQLAHYCGSQTPDPVNSNTNKLWIKYRTDFSVSGRGFHASYFSNCNTRLTSWSGVIESPNFPDPYYHNRNCTWIIQTTMGNTVNVSFSHFDIESHSSCTYDFLQIRDGNNMEANEIGTYCGETLPPTIVSTTESLWLNFMSDFSVAGNGFRLEYITNGCGGYLTSQTGSFTSPGYPNGYPHRRECIWEISLPTGTAIELTITDFDLESNSECRYDVLQVFEGSDTNEPDLTNGGICHTQKKPQVLTSTGNMMYIRFVSDSSVNGKGFQATYRGIRGGCGGNFSTPTGTLISKNYPENYPHNALCEWLITVRVDQSVVLTFEDFEVEGGGCRYDYVAGYDGPNRNSTELFKHCGTAVPSPSVFRSSGNQMFVRFRTDSSSAHRGFKATYTTGCGGELTGEEDGVITSPNYPNPYGMLNNCTWIIRGVHSTDRITLTFTYIDLEMYSSCIHDYVAVFDGDNANGTVIGRYCGNRIPASMTSQGSSMTVQFVSDPSVQLSGFRALYTKSISSCGGNFTAEHGSFTSPGYPNEYPLNTECVWTVYSPPGNKIMIAFSFFRMEDHLPNCNMDYLELREGNVHGRLIGRYCGDQSPTNLTAVNGIWAKFRSDDSYNEQGFVAQYSTVYGGSIIGSSGQVASPRYPNSYPNNADYFWTITTDVGSRIRINFQVIDIEGRNMGCIFDYIEFKDGDQADSPVLSRFCGSTVPETFYTTTNLLRVDFHSDIASFGRGFLFNWEATTDQPVTTTIASSTTQVPGCGGIIRLSPSSPTQTVTSPGYPNGYANNLDCVWQVLVPQGFRVWSNITNIDMESHGSCNYDYVQFYDNRERRDEALSQFCGREGNTRPIVTSRNEMAIELHTDYSVNRTGFSMNVKIVCGGVIAGFNGQISSDNYPISYPVNSNCSWLLMVPTGRTIRTQFNGTFNIAGSGTGCQGDYVQLFNGNSARSPALGSGTQGKYCGTNKPSSMETASYMLYVRFISDSRNNAPGFSLVFSEIQVTCGGHLRLTNAMTSSIFMSPNYPAVYPHNVDCTWIITVPANERIQIDFQENFDIENHDSCHFDYIEFRDGGTTNSRSLGRFCGRITPGTVKSTGNVMFARFRTDNSVPKIGFKAQYKIAICGGTIKGQSGYIQSPNFPSPYDNNMDCEWYIQAPTGHYMTFTYMSFNLQYNNNCTIADYVEIREYNATGDVIQRACGQTTPNAVDTSDSYGYVRFRSNSATTKPGFKLAFHASVEECGGDFTTPEGTFSSPNFPGRYPHSRNCVWKIQVPRGRRVTLRFDNFNIESHSNCRYDYVDVYNGVFYDSPKLQRLCGESNPGVLESYGNTMRVVFKTDGSISNGGFRASFSSREDTVCGGILMNPTEYISSIGYPSGNYSNNEECIWVIQNQNVTGSTIMLQFVDFSLESHLDCLYDFIEVREGNNENGQLIGRFCGNTTRPKPIFTPLPNLWVRYKSDHSNIDKGFRLKFTFTDCGGVLTSGLGEISSPNFPNYYNHSDSCAWLIMQPEGYRVNVHFRNFSLEKHPDCMFDFVEILNGGLPTSPSLGHFCGNSTPADFVSQSNAIRLIFNSDDSVAYNGFLLEYWQSAGGCGGLFHSNTGLITSPNHPQSYPNSIECQWDLNVQKGYHIILTFIPPFDLETHESCQYDYVELDDSLPNNTLVPRGRWCNNMTPPQQKSSSNRFVVRFRSDQNTHGTGFAANWTVGCGAIFRAKSGVFVSPGYPNDYGHNLLCNYTILADPGRFIVVQFDEHIFEIEGPAGCPYDSLTVYQGNDTMGGQVGKFCGTTVPQAVSGQSAVFLQFKTDDTVAGNGFRIGYRISECGGEFTAPYGYIRTPTNPTNYHHNANCTWLITVEDNRIVSLKFNAFELEAHRTCQFDYVDVYDGGDLSSPSIGRFCGEVIPDVLRTTGNQMLIHFVSDWSVSRGGFTATYRTTFGEAQGCGGVLNSTTGRITTGDGEYEHNLDCRWRIIVGDNKIVKLTIEGMEIESHSTCGYDFVQVVDGFNIDDPLIGTYCGVEVPAVIRSTSNVLLVRFYSDSAVNLAGFNATYVQEDAYCGGTRTASETPQTLSSPGYPSPVYQPIQCRWTIDTPEQNQLVLLTMTNLDLRVQNDCTDEYLEFRDTPMGTMGKSVLYCGGILPDAFDSVGNTVQVNLKMMGMASSSGFTLKYQIASCNRTYTGNSGQIYSPGWPNSYPQNSYCEMVVSSPPGTSLALYFNSFAVEPHTGCQFDSLLVRNGSSGTDLANLCGRGLPSPIFVPGNTVWMRFQTDNSVAHPGYSITYTAAYNGLGCGGNITGINGSLTSPGYPTNNTLRQTCRWLISTPAGRTITVRFSLLNVFGTPRCETSYVEVYNGRSEASPKFSRYCSSETIAPLQASSNQVLVRYVSDGSGSAPLFRLVFTS